MKKNTNLSNLSSTTLLNTPFAAEKSSDPDNSITVLAELANQVKYLRHGENPELEERLQKELISFTSQYGGKEGAIKNLVEIALEERLMAKLMEVGPDAFMSADETMTEESCKADAAAIMSHVNDCLDVLVELMEEE